MIDFFRRRPGPSLVLALLMFVTGGAVARHRGKTNAGLQSAEMQRQKANRPPSTAANRPWRNQLDLSRAQRVKDRLVLTLRDGTRLTLTLDPDLQKWSTDLLRRYELPYGALFLYDLKTGATLVMAGHSSDAPKMPAEDLCLVPWAPAASVFKLVTATALLENGVRAGSLTCYHGGLHGLYQHNLDSNPKLDKTCKSLSYAVTKSVNPIIGKLTLKYLDKRALIRWSRRFGFNRAIPFDMPTEPSRADIPKRGLELAKVAAGFWHTEASALHGAVIGGIAGNRGLLRWPHLVATFKKRRQDRPTRPRRAKTWRVMRPRNAEALARAMRNTTIIGTARQGFLDRRGRPFLGKIEVAGKTGSLARKKPFLHYNWFVGYAPVDKPRVAVAALLGNPAKWRIKAHTAARMLLAQYLNSTRPKSQAAKKLAHNGP